MLTKVDIVQIVVAHRDEYGGSGSTLAVQSPTWGIVETLPDEKRVLLFVNQSAEVVDHMLDTLAHIRLTADTPCGVCHKRVTSVAEQRTLVLGAASLCLAQGYQEWYDKLQNLAGLMEQLEV